MNKDEIESKINTIARKRDKAYIEAENAQKELETLMQQYYITNPDFVAVDCPTCGGIGYIKGNDNKKVICQNPYLPVLACKGMGYIWMKRYKKNEETKNKTNGDKK